MHILHTIEHLQAHLTELRQQGKRLAFVPTMGALHLGHLSLVTHAQNHADAVIVSVFVNPTQFGANEDFSRYPRHEASDCAMLAQSNTTIAWFPSVDAIYPQGTHAHLHAPVALSSVLCGAHRTGHFDGVVSVVMRLFDIIAPDSAVFGEKDFQQLTILRHASTLYHPNIHILGAPIIREHDGLAMSSRNAYLSAKERLLAPHLYATLRHIREKSLQGEDSAIALHQGSEYLTSLGFAVDYLEWRTEKDLRPALPPCEEPTRLFVAARLGKTRLIDNITLSITK